MNSNYNFVNSVIENFTTNNTYIQYYKLSFDDQRSIDLGNNKDFPAFYAVIRNIQHEEYVTNWSIDIFSLDLLMPNRANETDVMNNTSETINQFSNYIQNIQTDFARFINYGNSIPLNNFDDNRMNGWRFSFTVEFKREQCYDGGNFPTPILPGFTYSSPFLKCDTLADCETFQDLESLVFTNQNDITNLELQVGTNSALIAGLTTDLNNLEIDLGLLEDEVEALGISVSNIVSFTCSLLDTCPTILNIQNDIIDLENDLNNYLPLTGGTLTGPLNIVGNNLITFTGVSPQLQDASIGTDSSDNLLITAGLGSGKVISIGDNLRTYHLGSSFHRWVLDGNEAMRIIQNGNVGIGTTTPTRKLDVDGDIGFATDGDGNNGLFFQRITGNQWRLGTNGVGDVFRVQGNLVRFPQTVEIQRAGLTIRPTLTSLPPTSSVFTVRNLANTEIFRIQEGGNVGIGTDTPNQKLQVNGNARLGNVNDIFYTNNIHSLSSSDDVRILSSANRMINLNNSLYIDRTSGDVYSNRGVTESTIYGLEAARSVTGINNTAFGWRTLRNITSGVNNIGIGASAGQGVTTGNNNVCIGTLNGSGIGTANNNTYIGRITGRFNAGSNNTFVGELVGNNIDSGADLTNVSNSVLIGRDIKTLLDNESDVIVIGEGVTSRGTNTTLIGTDNTTDTYLRGELHVDVERWTIDLTEDLNFTLYATEDLAITEIDNIVGTPSIIILLNSTSYTLGDPIVSGDQIDIIVDVPSVIKLKIEK